MECVVCTRPGDAVKLVNYFGSKCCGSCKTAYYRSLTKLHEHVNENTKTDEIPFLDLATIQRHTWDFLCNADLCCRNRALDSTELCPIDVVDSLQCG